MNPNLDELEKLAKEATPGKRRNSYHPPSGCCHVLIGDRERVLATVASHTFPNKVVEDGELIAACDPDTILGLIARIKKLEAALRQCADGTFIMARRDELINIAQQALDSEPRDDC